MKRLIGLTLLCGFMVSLAGPALAWEYHMKGETVWRYRYLSRTGANDIFGFVGGVSDLGVNHVKNWPTPSTNSQHNNNIGILAGEPGFGADADQTDYRATLYPKIKINKAISLSGSVNLTSLGIHSGGRPWDNYGTPGNVNSMWVPISNRMAQANVPNMFVTLQWWKISVKLPWFGNQEKRLRYGYREEQVPRQGLHLVQYDCRVRSDLHRFFSLLWQDELQLE